MTEAQGIVGEFLSLKAGADADLLAMQCGDFYEFFAEDAETVADELDLKLSQKSSGGDSYPMAGVPLTELTPYLKALVERGYRVAVADQREVDGGHEREVVRVVTPGTLLSATAGEARYLASVVRGDGEYGLAFADVTTGRFHATTVAERGDVLSECYRFSPTELLPGPAVREDESFVARLREETGATVSFHQGEAFAPGRATHTVGEQFGAETAESVGLEEAAVRAAGGVLSYVEATGSGVLASMTRLGAYGTEGVDLDATTQRNLELTETMQGDREGSLVHTVDHTVSSAGGRLLAEWITRPRQDVPELRRRADGVEALASSALAREELRELLGGTYDLARLASRAVSGSADARDLLRVADSLGTLPDLAEAVEADPALSASPVAGVLERVDRERAADLRATLDDALVEDPPGSVREGGLVRRGYDDDLDALIDDHEEALEWIDGLEEREKGAHGITHLTVDRNRTDGYYIQVGKSETEKVPEEYEGIKTLKNAERYTHPELEEREREILRLEERRSELEYELFCELREAVAERAALLQDVGRALAELDVLAGLATHAAKHDWTRPSFVESGLAVEAGRHPVVERTVEFVPNDLRLDDERRFLVVTGPNMSGKSTYMRQAALIALLAQVGSFVPARSVELSPVDGIYTRVGALDELSQGRSTFMVEMQELANILHSASEDSLVVLDEVGRGTATYDGISIAWAATEYLHNEVRAKTLFATHYHELTGLADRLERVANVHVAVADEAGAGEDGDITFLRTVQEGPTDRSYGVHVADLAGVPDPVVERSRDVLRKLEAEEAIDVRGRDGTSETHQTVFDLGSGQFRGAASADGGDEDPLDPATESVLEELRSTNVEGEAPLDLMATVEEWQERLESADDG